MGDFNIEKLLAEHEEKIQLEKTFNEITQNNIETIQQKQKEITEKCEQIDEIISTIKELTKHARYTAYVSLTPLCKINATIKHTGEYNVKFNENYQCTMTADQTIEYLDKKRKDLKIDRDIYEGQLIQLMKRLNIEEDVLSLEMEDMPDKIYSEKGVAVKDGMFYEIIEKVDDDPMEETKGKERISRVKTKK